jgi:hypothetical protein
MTNPEHLAILQQGVSAWNQWREDFPQHEPDLLDAKLSSAGGDQGLMFLPPFTYFRYAAIQPAEMG